MTEADKELIKARIKAGIQDAKAKGKRIGRKPMPPSERKRILDMYIEEPDMTAGEIAAKLKTKKSTVYKTLSLFKTGRLDRDGFVYESSLCP